MDVSLFKSLAMHFWQCWLNKHKLLRFIKDAAWTNPRLPRCRANSSAPATLSCVVPGVRRGVEGGWCAVILVGWKQVWYGIMGCGEKSCGDRSGDYALVFGGLVVVMRVCVVDGNVVVIWSYEWCICDGGDRWCDSRMCECVMRHETSDDVFVWWRLV